ncbi:hypothetical protein HDV01_000050 [Terramyces sp. JEL0728]|nr:hypothetical protein HDV01_000050 [Terramyces sp. JEL0728]
MHSLKIAIPKERKYSMQDFTIEPVTFKDLNIDPKKLQLQIPKEREYFIEEKVREPYTFEELITNHTLKRKDSGFSTEAMNKASLRVTIPDIVYQPEDNLDLLDCGDQWMEHLSICDEKADTPDWVAIMANFKRN